MCIKTNSLHQHNADVSYINVTIAISTQDGSYADNYTLHQQSFNYC